MTYKTHETLCTKTNDQANQKETCSHSVSTVIIPTGLVKTILQGTMKGERRQGIPKKRWEDNIREWTRQEFAESQRTVENREKRSKLVVKSSVVPKRPQG